jgi:MtrB/PioB family decaheme-associated outer membrane protein
MTTPRHSFPLRASAVAVRSAVIAMTLVQAASAAEPLDPAVLALVQRTSSVEVGIGNLSDGAYKANEYGGLKSQGPFLLGNFDIRRGGGYASDDPTRFRLTGIDVGTESRSVEADYSLGGATHFYLDYDQLLRNRSDTYQTPYLGAGTSVLTLPGSWLVPLVPRVSGSSPNARGLSPAVTSSSALVAGVLTAPTAGQLATAAAIQGADLPAFHSVELYTKRTKYTAGAVIAINRLLEVSGSFSHEDKVGLKPLGTVTAVTGGDISTIIPDLINQTTEQLDLGLKYKLGALTLEGAYDASIFTNEVKGMTWTNWALPTSTQTISSAPSNQFHQARLTASFTVSPTTRVVADASYARGTQNQAFLTASYAPIVPVASASALVVTKVANLKLSSRPLKDLALNANYKFEDRDNKTPVNTYGFYDAGVSGSGTSVFSSYYPGLTLGSNLNLNANRPYSKRTNQFDLGADYHVAEGQAIRAGAQYQVISRNCPGSWISCADADKAKEGTLDLEWRGNFLNSFDARIGAAHSRRTVDYNEDAWLAIVPAANLSPTGAPGGSTAYATMLANGWTGYGPVSGLNPLPTVGSAAAFFFANNNALSNALYGSQNRISELPGMRRYNMADRQRDKVRSAFDWQASDKLSVQAGVDYNRDEYAKSVYGLKRAQSVAANLDASYAFSETLKVTGFFSHEDQRSIADGNSYTANSTATAVNGATAISSGCFATIALRNASNKVDPCLNWDAKMHDSVNTFGASYLQKNLLGGKLDVSAGVAVSLATSTNNLAGGNYVNNPLAVTGAPSGTVAAYYVPAAPLPVVKTNTVDFKLSGKYALSSAAAVRLGYRYQHMTSSDWSYDGLQYGGLSGVLPTGELAPSYGVHTFVVSYVYNFL